MRLSVVNVCSLGHGEWQGTGEASAIVFPLSLPVARFDICALMFAHADDREKRCGYFSRLDGLVRTDDMMKFPRLVSIFP